MTIAHALLALAVLLLIVLYVKYRQAITLNKTYEDEIALLKESEAAKGYHAERMENAVVKKIDELIFRRAR